MQRVFLDTNILLDILLKRDDFEQSREILLVIEKWRFLGGISAISFNNIDYIVRKYKNFNERKWFLNYLLHAFSVIPLDKWLISQAIAIPSNDFEDAIQYISALRFDADCIITNNVHDFWYSSLSVYSPHEFVKKFLK